MADVAEILKFREYAEKFGKDDYHYKEITEQLKLAIFDGHDVQLHLHSSYFNATFKNGRWNQYWPEYNLAELPYDRIDELIRVSKEFLENLLISVNKNYKCHIFRAANWSMQPSNNIVRSLLNNNINIDTSVFKHGMQSGIVDYNYSNAYSEIIPWYVEQSDICRRDECGELLEVPIYCENRNWIAFVTPIRIFRMIRAIIHRHKFTRGFSVSRGSGDNKKNFFQKFLLLFFKNHPWKLDFNQATGRQLINAVKRISQKNGESCKDLPIVLIGHSKSFLKCNEITLKPFLKYLSQNPDFKFSLFSDIPFLK